MRTSVPVTSQGSPYGRLRRAFDSGNATISACRRVGDADARSVCGAGAPLLPLDQEPEEFSRAAVRGTDATAAK